MFFWRLETTKGPFYTVFLAYLLVALIGASTLYLSAAVTNGKKHRRLFVDSFLVSLIPVLFFMAEIYDPFKTGLDFLSTGMLTSIALLSYVGLRSTWKAVAQRAKADLFQNDENPMILIDRGFTLLDFNAKAEQYFPELDESVLGLNLKSILVRGKMLLEHLEHPMHPNLDFKYGENLYTFEIKTINVTDERKIELGTLIRLIDVSEIRKERESLHRLATRDSLTGLLNRRQFMSLARLAFERNRIDDSGLGVLLFNIDKFSEINRTFGTHVGDEVLRGVSAKLSEVFRKSDVVGRIGGEEFAVVLPSIKAEDALKLAMKCCILIREATFTFDGKTVQTTISGGVSVTRSKEDPLDEILRCAYVALKESKEKGRNQVSLYVENTAKPTDEVK
jgi:diguanylate cyclase (GGDEF)-like protein